jgi:hypothetical protein
MEARWAGSPEPVPAQVKDPDGKQTGFLYDLERILAPSRVDIYPGESESLDVAVLYDDEDKCFGWNNESYFQGFRHPRYQLPGGQYLVSGGYCDVFRKTRNRTLSANEWR